MKINFLNCSKIKNWSHRGQLYKSKYIMLIISGIDNYFGNSELTLVIDRHNNNC